MSAPMKPTIVFVWFASLMFIVGSMVLAETTVDSAHGLLARTVPELVGKVVFVEIPAKDGNDVFELQTKDGKLVVSGNNGVSMASGFHWYLKHYCHCQISLRARQLKLPDPLPVAIRLWLDGIEKGSPIPFDTGLGTALTELLENAYISDKEQRIIKL